MKATNKFVFLWILFFASAISGLGYFLPIYSDEVAFKSTSARWFIDQFQVLAWTPQCHTSLVSDLPWFFYLQKVMDSLLYGVLPVASQIRVFAILNFFLILTSTWVILKSIGLSRRQVIVSYLGFISLISMGVLPWMMLINRPEATLVLFAFLAVALSLRSVTIAGKVLSLVGLSFIVPYSLATHPKSLFLAPLILLANFLLTKGLDRFIQVGSFVLFIYFYAHAHHFYSHDVCETAPLLQEWSSSVAMKPSEVLELSGAEFKERLKFSFFFKPYVENILIQASHQGNWFPMIIPASELDLFLNRWIVSLFQFLALLLPVFCILSGIEMYFKRNFRRSVFLGFTLYLVFFLATFFIRSTNFYESAFRLPLFLMALLLVTPLSFLRMPNFLAFLLLSPVLFLGGASLIQGSYYMAHYSINRSSQAEVSRPHVQTAARACGISLDGTSVGLVVEPQIMLEFWEDLILPIKINDVTDFFGRDITNLPAFLDALNSDGLLVRCEQIPPKADFGKIQRVGDYCCRGGF